VVGIVVLGCIVLIALNYDPAPLVETIMRSLQK
jgi:hypothetical protein